MDEVAPLLRYWGKEPPVHKILFAVHCKPREKRGLHSNHENVSEAELIASGFMKMNRNPKHG